MKNDVFIDHFKNIQTTNIVYLLHHPKSKFSYVGKSSSGLVEPNSYRSGSGIRQVHRWVQEMIKDELQYEIEVLEHFPDPSFLDEAEKFYIEQFRSLGVQLLNETDGGEGKIDKSLVLPFGYRMRILMAFETYGVDPVVDIMNVQHAIVSKAVIGMRMRRGTILLIVQGFNRFLEFLNRVSQDKTIAPEEDGRLDC